MDDYPSDGQAAGVFPAEPDKSQVEEIRSELANIAREADVYRGLIDWFNEQMTLAESIRNIDPESNVPVDVQVLANKRLCDLLLGKRQELETNLGAYETALKERVQSND